MLLGNRATSFKFKQKGRWTANISWAVDRNACLILGNPAIDRVDQELLEFGINDQPVTLGYPVYGVGRGEDSLEFAAFWAAVGSHVMFASRGPASFSFGKYSARRGGKLRSNAATGAEVPPNTNRGGTL